MLLILASVMSVGSLSAPFLPQVMSNPQRQTALTLIPMADAALRRQDYKGQMWSELCQKGTERAGFTRNNPSTYESFRSALIAQGATFLKEKRVDILFVSDFKDRKGYRWIMVWLPGISANDAVAVLCQYK